MKRYPRSILFILCLSFSFAQADSSIFVYSSDKPITEVYDEVYKSMVFCNVWYANQVSNKDPSMLALCPLHMTLIEKDGSTTALFARPTVIAADSPARGILADLESEVITAIKKGMD